MMMVPTFPVARDVVLISILKGQQAMEQVILLSINRFDDDDDNGDKLYKEQVPMKLVLLDTLELAQWTRAFFEVLFDVELS